MGSQCQVGIANVKLLAFRANMKLLALSLLVVFCSQVYGGGYKGGYGGGYKGGFGGLGGWGGWPGGWGGYGGWGGGGYWGPWGPGNLGFWGQGRTRNMMYNPYFANTQMYPYKGSTYFTKQHKKKDKKYRKKRSILLPQKSKYKYSFRPMKSERPASYFPYYPGWALSPHYSYAKAAYLNSLRKKFYKRKLKFMKGSSGYGNDGSNTYYGSGYSDNNYEDANNYDTYHVSPSSGSNGYGR